MSKPGKASVQPSFASWWKHLRKLGKRAFWKRERKEAKQQARTQ